MVALAGHNTGMLELRRGMVEHKDMVTLAVRLVAEHKAGAVMLAVELMVGRRNMLHNRRDMLRSRKMMHSTARLLCTEKKMYRSEKPQFTFAIVLNQ